MGAPQGSKGDVRQPFAASVAGFDPTGGAGVIADVKVIEALGVRGLGIVAAFAPQGPGGIARVASVTEALIEEQMQAVSVLPIRAVKTGVLLSSAAVESVASWVRRLGVPLVVDPVIRASDGTPLLEDSALAVLEETLLPLAALCTPNAPEATELSGISVADPADAVRAGEAIIKRWGPQAVLVKGGHMGGEEVVDLLVTQEGTRRFQAPRIPGAEAVHGTGCMLSAAVAAGLAAGLKIEASVERALGYVRDVLRVSTQGEASWRLPRHLDVTGSRGGVTDFHSESGGEGAG